MCNQREVVHTVPNGSSKERNCSYTSCSACALKLLGPHIVETHCNVHTVHSCDELATHTATLIIQHRLSHTVSVCYKTCTHRGILSYTYTVDKVLGAETGCYCKQVKQVIDSGIVSNA